MDYSSTLLRLRFALFALQVLSYHHDQARIQNLSIPNTGHPEDSLSQPSRPMARGTVASIYEPT